MKRLSLYISILWLISMSVGFAVPEVHVQNPVCEEEQEFKSGEESDKSDDIQIDSSSEAILSSFQFHVAQHFSLIPKLFLVAKIEKSSRSFEIRDFQIFNWKVLFTKIIQVHGP